MGKPESVIHFVTTDDRGQPITACWKFNPGDAKVQKLRKATCQDCIKVMGK